MAIGIADRLSPRWIGKEASHVSDVIEALGRPYEYDEGVLEELTSIWVQAEYLHGRRDSQYIPIALKTIHH